MQKDDLVFVGHMLDMARLVVGKAAGKLREDFDRDENLRFALAHHIQTIGEAARRVSPAFQAAHPQVPWKTIIGMRHKVVHDYLQVNFNIVWNVATNDMRTLLAELEKIMLTGPSDMPR
jgi:uncharacterized protein with HEPN domain